MTGDELERAIAFIIGQQAQFTANQQRHDEALRNHEETMRRIEEAQERTALQVQQTTLQIQHLGGAMVELTEAHTRTENTLAEAHARTENTLAETNDKLNALIDTVERHISEGRDGKA